MTTLDLFENALTQWKESKFKGTIVVPKPYDPMVLLMLTLDKIYTKNPNKGVILCCGSWNERQSIVEILCHKGDEELNKTLLDAVNNKHLKIITADIFKTQTIENNTIFINYDMNIVSPEVYRGYECTKYNLSILHTAYLGSDSAKFYSYSPQLTAFTEGEIEQVRVSTPIEEIGIDVTIPENSEDYALLKYYDEYISTSLSIFGSFDNMEKARVGDKSFNISATQICYRIAKDNGWDEHLDMSSELNVQIDANFNPNNILDRAYKTYEIIRNRNELLASYQGKIPAVIKIIEEHPDAQILIINKKGEFAAELTDKINRYFCKTICGDFHDKLDKVPYVNSRGLIERVKSGPNKGEVRMAGAKTQCTRNQKLFLEGKLKVLSTSNLPLASLKGYVDIIIVTSPSCEDMETYLYRLREIRFNDEQINLYTIYVKNSIENQRLMNKKRNRNHSLNVADNFNINNENNLGFIVVD